MPRHRAWSDQSLKDVLAKSTSWKDVCLRLGVPVGGKTVNSLRRRAIELGLDVGHLYGGGRRGLREFTVTDDHLAGLVRASVSWHDLALRLGYRSALRGAQYRRVRARIEQLGLTTTHFMSRGYNGLRPHLPNEDMTFEAPPDPKRLRFAAIGKAIFWFAERGYVVATPVEPAPYDLLVDTGDSGIKRVQVKSSASCRREVITTRSVYRTDRPGCRTTGLVQQEPYQPGVIDYFFIVMVDGSVYLIPYGIVGPKRSIRMGHRYQEYRVA